MQRIRELAACIFTACFCMAAGAAAYHQHEVLSRKQDRPAYEFTFNINSDSGTVITGYAVDEPEYEVYEMSAEDMEEEEYMDTLELLAECVEAEAGNQGLTGKRLVADVILNRVDSPDFPDTIEGVITQPYHFTSYWDGRIDTVSVSDETYEAVQMELEQRSYPGLLYFTAGAYGCYGTPWQQVGDHYFSTK